MSETILALLTDARHIRQVLTEYYANRPRDATFHGWDGYADGLEEAAERVARAIAYSGGDRSSDAIFAKRGHEPLTI